MWALVITPLDLITTGCVLIFGALIAAVLLRAAVSVAAWLTDEPLTLPMTTPKPSELPEPAPSVEVRCVCLHLWTIATHGSQTQST